MKNGRQKQKWLCFLYEKNALDRWICRCKRSCDEINALFECDEKKKKRRR
ncbi:MAG: hypothetical protein IKU83_01060 [Lachnospiraceae bacterium]|nr:hypothetical protein [Lachnospiraceae bacterium]